MKCSTATLVYVTGTLDAVKDELLTCCGSNALDDAVQIDITDIEEALDSNILSSETVDYVVAALMKCKGDTYQFI